MKKMYFLIVLSMITLISFAQNKVVVSENFENATVSSVDAQITAIGLFRGGNYGTTSTWTIDLETTYPISGNKSAHINVKNTATDWWALQFKLESNLLPLAQQFTVNQGKDYIVNFKIMTSVATNTNFYVFDTHNFTYPLQLKGAFELQNYSINVPQMEKTANTANFCIGMGNPSVPTEFWLDDFVVYEVQSTGLNDNSIKNIKLWSNNKQLFVDSPESRNLIIYNNAGQEILRQSINQGVSSINVPGKNDFVIVNVNKNNNNNIFKVILK